MVDCPYTLMGSPTVVADLAVSGEFSEIASRLWEVAPDGTQSLVAHGLYRPRLDNLGPQVFQLHPTSWQFNAGYGAKLELLGQSSPYGRASNGTFTITATNVEVRLPVHETPGSCLAVQSPAPPVFPPTVPEATTTTTTPSTTTTTTQPPPAQLVRGSSFRVRSPGYETQRKVTGQARERNSNDTIVGDPVASGASLEVVANGATSSVQTFDLPKEGWRRIGSFGFQYSNRLPGGPVSKASIKKTSNGTLQMKLAILGRYGSLTVVPPNPGSDGGFVLTLGGGDRYCVGFRGAAGGVAVRDDATQWYVKSPTAEACP